MFAVSPPGPIYVCICVLCGMLLSVRGLRAACVLPEVPVRCL